MTKNTPKMGRMPAGSIDFDKVHARAKSGEKDIFKGAVSHTREEIVDKDEQKVIDASAEVRAEEVAAATDPAAADTGKR